MSDSTWEIAKKALQDDFKLTVAQLVAIENIREKVKKYMVRGLYNTPHFTLHNEIHSDNIISIIGDILKASPNQLTSKEGILLALSVYLHDIGMFFDEYRLDQEILPELNDKLGFCQQCDPTSDYRDKLLELGNNNLGEKIRILHHLLSAYIIRNEGVDLFNLNVDELSLIINICRGHRRANIQSSKCRCYKQKDYPGYTVRQGLLASLLRLGDALDFYRNRTPLSNFKSHEFSFIYNPIAIKHWTNHYFAYNVSLIESREEAYRWKICFEIDGMKQINGISYNTFFTPLIESFISHTNEHDLNIEVYPVVFQEFLDTKALVVEKEIINEPSRLYPQKLIDYIEEHNLYSFDVFINNLLENKIIYENPFLFYNNLNRNYELESFNSLINQKGKNQNIIFLKGGTGQGKTRIIENYSRYCQVKGIPFYTIDLEKENLVTNLISEMIKTFGLKHFPTFLKVKENDNLETLSSAFYKDLINNDFNKKLVLIFDSYEKSSVEMKNWICKELFPQLKGIENLLIVIGGQKLPKLDTYWQKVTRSFILKNVQLIDCFEYAKRAGAKINEKDIFAIYNYTNGNPKSVTDLFALGDEDLKDIIYG